MCRCRKIVYLARRPDPGQIDDEDCMKVLTKTVVAVINITVFAESVIKCIHFCYSDCLLARALIDWGLQFAWSLI